MPHEQHDAACSGYRVEWSKSWQYHFEMGIVRARAVKFNVKIASFACKGAYCSLQRENSVVRVPGSLNLTFAHMGKSGKLSATPAGWFV